MFITFEGPDGSGKTTQIKAISAYLQQRGHDVLLTREPGGTAIGDQIRAVLLDNPENTTMHPRTELLLFCASRAQIVAEVIRPHLEKGGIVICDRYADSTMAYQGYGHGLDLDELRAILDFATGKLYPDLTLYLDIDPETALKRRAEGSLFGEEFNRLDDMEMEFHRRVYEGYEALITAEPKRWQRINATQTVEKIQTDIVAILDERLPKVKTGNG